MESPLQRKQIRGLLLLRAQPPEFRHEKAAVLVVVLGSVVRPPPRSIVVVGRELWAEVSSAGPAVKSKNCPKIDQVPLESTFCTNFLLISTVLNPNFSQMQILSKKIENI